MNACNCFDMEVLIIIDHSDWAVKKISNNIVNRPKVGFNFPNLLCTPNSMCFHVPQKNPLAGVHRIIIIRPKMPDSPSVSFSDSIPVFIFFHPNECFTFERFHKFN